jgi:hypothetical protein
MTIIEMLDQLTDMGMRFLADLEAVLDGPQEPQER